MPEKNEKEAKRLLKLETERARTEKMKQFEREHPDCRFICGVDEAGRGPLAGPVVAGAVVLDLDNPEKEILYLNDSKKLSEKKREALYREILSQAVAVGIGIAGAKVIDRINILQATYLAMYRAVNNLTDVSGLVSEDADVHELVEKFVKFNTNKSIRGVNRLAPDFILADAVHIPDIDIPQQGIIQGDAKSISIAAASIVAKVSRDHIMLEYDKQFPEYGFASHKGYGTAAHRAAIARYGMTDIHRRSFIHL